MALFRAAIRRDSVSLLRFPFLIHVKVFSCRISLVSCLKCPYSCFSFPFLFSSYCSVDDCVACNVAGGCNQSSSELFMKSSSRCIDSSTQSSMLTRPLPHSFLDTCSLSTSSLGCKALCIVMSFLVL